MPQESISSENNSPEKLHFSEVEELREPVEKILAEIAPRLEKGEYQLLIGDDASGRVPTWVWKKIIGEMYEEKGFPPIETVYIAGSGSSGKSQNLTGGAFQEKKEKIEDFLKYLSEGKESQKIRVRAPLSRVLISTDSVFTGTSLDPLMEVLKEGGIPFDIIAIGLQKTHSGDKGIRSGQKIIYGKIGLPGVDGSSHLSGVGKFTRFLFSHTRNPIFVNVPISSEEENKSSETVRKSDLSLSREDATRLAKEIVEKYHKEKTGKDDIK
ncbi:MAG: hypothetical protein WC878_03840 [Candidatus Paceibacterota bacterium]|jgi:hypothetical protein